MASRALVIGVGAYDEGSHIPGYPTVEASARAYGTALALDPRWGASARSTVLERDEVRTADSVMRALHEAAAAAESAEDTLLVVYVGHGNYWPDVPGGQVHFALGASRSNEPWTWLSAWYVYRAIRKSRAGLKILITDCCYSNILPYLGPESALPGALETWFQGTCVLTAVSGQVHSAPALACPNLPASLDTCTPFSGHLLNVLRQGMPTHSDDLTLGALRAGIGAQMGDCGVHPQPRMLLNDASESAPLFTNRARGREPQRPALTTVAAWVSELLLNGTHRLGELMNRPDLAGGAAAQLRLGDDQSRELARSVGRKAGELLSDPSDFVKYWDEFERATLGRV